MLNKTNIYFLVLYLFIVYILIEFYPINPTAFNIGPFPIQWYGILFSATFFISKFKMSHDIKRINPTFGVNQSDALILYSFAGIVIGARLLFVVFYEYNELSQYIEHPFNIINIRKGGLSFHGGLIGLIIGVLLYCRKYKVQFLKCMDIIALTAPIGLAEGRLGNFINGELWGKITTLPVGMVFESGGPFERHPSQLYESFLEGIVLFFILKIFARKERSDGSVCGLFLVLYAIFRFAIEFVREPDANLGYLAWNWLTMGQILCIPMFLIGLFLLFFKKSKLINFKQIII